jgi:hypothetical protein
MRIMAVEDWGEVDPESTFLLSCMRCGVVIDSDLSDKHEAFHATLNKLWSAVMEDR